DFIKYDIKIEGKNYNHDEKNIPANKGTITHSGVPSGKYTVTVKATLNGYQTPLSPDLRKIPYATGTETVVVKAGQTEKANITMSGDGFCKDCKFELKEPTCTEDEALHQTCKKPAHNDTHFVVAGSALPHELRWVETTAPSFVKEGVEKGTCTGSGCQHTETRHTDPLPITGIGDWNTAIGQIVDTSASYALLLANDNTITIGQVSENSLPANLTITGYGKVRTIQLTNTGSLFTIGSGKSLTIKDIELQGNPSNNASLVSVNGGTFTMNGNSSVTGNKIASGYGGGVTVQNSGNFFMNDNSSVTGNGTNSGHGGGVYVIVGILKMSGNASVSDNTANGTSVMQTGRGGGVIVISGTFEMSGSASVSDNTSKGVATGGGVCVGADSTFKMSDNASVSNNTASDTTAGYGGGVYILNADFIMLGGTITGNNALSQGGGVCVAMRSFTMSGGTISGNTATTGESLYVINGTAKYSNGENIIATGNNTNDPITGK
ncbi:MAG: hypothetical protein LBH44_12545, partial [Treponema sp.]|nr:hypothetical protein [Treponema sp.]